MTLLLDGHAAFPVGQVARVEVGQDGLLEHLPHVFGRHVEALLNLAGLDVLILHLLVVLADLCKDDLVLVEEAVLADLPEGDGGDGVDADVELSGLDDALAHLDHGALLLHLDLAFAADADDHVLGLHDGHEVDLELEHDVHLLYQVLPVLQRQPDHLRDVELLEVVLLLEAGRVDGVAGHVLDGEDVLVLLPLLLLALLGELLPELVALLAVVVLALLLVHDAEDGEVAGGGDVADVLVELEDEAAIGDDLAPLLEGLVEVGLLLQLDAAVVQRVRVERGEAVLPPVLALVVHHVVVVADRMHVHEGALADAAHPRSVLQPHRVGLTPRALHQLSNYYTH